MHADGRIGVGDCSCPYSISSGACRTVALLLSCFLPRISRCADVAAEIIFKAARKRLSLKPANLEHGEPLPKRQAPALSPVAALLEGLKEDPDVLQALKNPRCKEAYDDVVANGLMAGMKYLSDPHCKPVSYNRYLSQRTRSSPSFAYSL